MAWFADLAGKAENLLNNLDEQTGAALRNHNVVKSKKHEKIEYGLHQEPPWAQKKRPTARSLKKVSIATETKSSNFVPNRKSSPSSHVSSRQSKSPDRDSQDHVNNVNLRPSRKKSPMRKPNTQYSLNHCPKTLVGDVRDSEIDVPFGPKQRRYSLPADLELLSSEDMTYKMQNIEVENAMLKNELNVMNGEVTELLERLQKTDDDLHKTHTKYEKSEIQNQNLSMELESMNSQLKQLRQKIHDITNNDIQRHKEKCDTLETQISILNDRNEELEEKLKELTDKTNDNNSLQMKLETELRYAQSTISTLQGNLEKSTAECHRLEKDWEAYKLRVKGMLFAKDNEIKALQDGVTVGEDTRTLTEELERLKEEREGLTEAVSRVQNEGAEMKQYIEHLETRHAAAERVVTALRDALRDERAANNRAEAQYVALGKELKTLQMETGQTIASLRATLLDKDSELHNIRITDSSIRTTDTSALNVADYDVKQESVDNDRIHYLTEALVQKQGRIDALLADNNMLRIQLAKLECKYKAEVQATRSNRNHVVHLQDERRRLHAPTASLSGLTLKVGVMMKRHPVFRMFIIVYMICLHLWVLTVLFTSTPDGHFTRHAKS